MMDEWISPLGNYLLHEFRYLMIVLAVLSSFSLSACTEPTRRSERSVTCAPMPDYPEYFLATAAQELAYLPDDSAVEQMLDDYRYLRRQLQDWHAMTCNR